MTARKRENCSAAAVGSATPFPSAFIPCRNGARKKAAPGGTALEKHADGRLGRQVELSDEMLELAGEVGQLTGRGRWLDNPRAVRPATSMPPVRLTAEEKERLLGILTSD